MPDTKKYLDDQGLLYYHGKIKDIFVNGVAWDSTNNKITKTIGSSTTDVVTAATLKTAMSLNEVGNFKAVSTVANQGLSDQEKRNARDNIGAGSSGLTSVSYDTTNDKIIYTDAGGNHDVVTAATLKADMGLPADFDGSFSKVTSTPTTLAGYGITDAKIESGVITLGSNTITPVTDISGKADVATTLAGYGITDASVNPSTGVFTLGSNTYTVKIDNGELTVGSNTWSLTNVYKYKGSVATKAVLDAMTKSSLTPGDVYNVEADGQNYAYVSWDNTTNKPVWDALGGTFTIASITNADIDAIIAGTYTTS